MITPQKQYILVRFLLEQYIYNALIYRIKQFPVQFATES